MSKIILSGVLLLAMFQGYAQPNNPFNQRGLDYLRSVEIVKADIDAGKQLELDEATISHYSQIIPLKHEVTPELAAEVASALKNPEFNFIESVQSSSLSEFTKETLVSLVVNSKPGDQESYKKFLVEKTNEILSGPVREDEKEFLLTQVAIVYNVANNDSNTKCYVTSERYQQEIDCVTYGVVTGAYIGFTLCGPWCA
ncbi:MAG: hypothetical protein H0U44_06205, partial [Flavisolibacter sp.]|nr:hypothetical protein [Flavisolibacter sp.]